MASKSFKMRLLAFSTLASTAVAFPKMGNDYSSAAYGGPDGIATAVPSEDVSYSTYTYTETFTNTDSYGSVTTSVATETSVYDDVSSDYGYATSSGDVYSTNSDYIPTSSDYAYTTSTGNIYSTNSDYIPTSSGYAFTTSTGDIYSTNSDYVPTSTYSNTYATETPSINPTDTYSATYSTGTYSATYPTPSTSGACDVDVGSLDDRCEVLYKYVGQNDLQAVCDLYVKALDSCEGGASSTYSSSYSYPTTSALYGYGNSSTVTGTGITYASPTLPTSLSNYNSFGSGISTITNSASFSVSDNFGSTITSDAYGVTTSSDVYGVTSSVGTPVTNSFPTDTGISSAVDTPVINSLPSYTTDSATNTYSVVTAGNTDGVTAGGQVYGPGETVVASTTSKGDYGAKITAGPYSFEVTGGRKSGY